MRISDWRSDVCSSDLVPRPLEQGQVLRIELAARLGHRIERNRGLLEFVIGLAVDGLAFAADAVEVAVADILLLGAGDARHQADRKSVVYGKSVTVRVDIGGRGVITQEKKHNK